MKKSIVLKIISFTLEPFDKYGRFIYMYYLCIHVILNFVK